MTVKGAVTADVIHESPILSVKYPQKHANQTLVTVYTVCCVAFHHIVSNI